MPIDLHLDDAPFAARLATAFRHFAGEATGRGRPGELSRGRAGGKRLPGRGAPTLKLQLDAAAIWTDDSPEPRVSQDEHRLLVEHRDFIAVLATNAEHMAVVQPPRVISTENALRVLLALALARKNGLLLHAAGVVNRGAATVLFGRSGSGKSTSARLARGRPILGDDLVALTRESDGWRAHSTPFGGPTARRRRSRSAPLRSLLRLRHGPELELLPLAPAAAVSELLQSTVLPAAGEAERANALALCAELAEQAQVRELRFPVDHALWRWLGERGV